MSFLLVEVEDVVEDVVVKEEEEERGVCPELMSQIFFARLTEMVSQCFFVAQKMRTP